MVAELKSSLSGKGLPFFLKFPPSSTDILHAKEISSNRFILLYVSTGPVILILDGRGIGRGWVTASCNSYETLSKKSQTSCITDKNYNAAFH